MRVGGWRARSLLAAGALLAVLAGCGGSGNSETSPPGDQPPLPSGVAHREIVVDGTTRSYRLFLPPELSRQQAVPLVMVLHSAGGTGDKVAQITQLDRAATAGGFIAVYPDGLRGTWNAGFCCGSAATNNVNDLGFLTALIDRLEAMFPIDPSRVYVVGPSNGAIMAYRLACTHAGQVAGVGSVAGVMLTSQCHPDRPVSVIEIHGTADELVPYSGGAMPRGSATGDTRVPSTPAVAERWANLDGCGTTPERHTREPVTTLSWTECRAGTAVRLITIEGAEHTWYAPGFGPVNGAVDATQAITDFFGLSAGWSRGG